MLFREFNDQFALILTILILLIWAGIGLKIFTLPGEVIGTLISVFLLVANFYFRKSPPPEK